MSELLLDKLDEEFFKVGLDYKRDYDPYEEHHLVRVLCGEQHIDLSPLWSAPSSGDDDIFFFDDDDIVAELYSYGNHEETVNLFVDSEEELVSIVVRIFEEGVDFLHDLM